MLTLGNTSAAARSTQSDERSKFASSVVLDVPALMLLNVAGL